MPEKGYAIQSRRSPPQPEPIDLAIVYQDEWLVAIDKPAGMVVHPTYKNWSGTVLNGLLWKVRGEPRIVTRLDKDTSGLVLVALTSEVHAGIQRDMHGGRVKKEYLAVVRGTPTPPSGTIVLPLARSPEDRRVVVVDERGQRCETRYELMGRPEGRGLHRPEVSLVRCELVTGRTHQIRVHLAARGWPILGDRVYGEASAALPRQALHAWRLTLRHPVSRQTLEIEAAVPPDLQQFLDDQNLKL